VHAIKLQVENYTATLDVNGTFSTF